MDNKISLRGALMNVGSRAVASSALFMAAVLYMGCRDTDSVHSVLGVPQIVVESPNGTQYLQTWNVDFGSLLVQTQVSKTVTIANLGRGAFRVASVQRSDSFPEAFSYEFSAKQVEPGAQVSFELRFQPTAAGAVAGALDFVFANAEPSRLRVNLAGMGVDPACTISPESTLSFGSVALGASRVAQVAIRNGSSLPWTASVSEIVGDQSGGFSFSPGFETGDHTIPAASEAAGELLIPVNFLPTHVGEFSGRLVVSGPGGGCSWSIALQGIGVEHVLKCEPQLDSGGIKACGIDFGYVSPGTRVVRAVTFQNVGLDPVTVSLGAVSQPQGFGDPFSLNGPSAVQLELPAGGSPVAVELAFQPTLLGAQPASLAFTSTDSSWPLGRISLLGVGGGPLIDVQPDRVDFNVVAKDTEVIRRITLANIGTDVPETTLDNLLLTSAPRIENDSFGELSLVSWPPAGYSATGLAEGESVDVLLRFKPTVLGVKSFTLRILTNDPSKPDGVAIPVVGTGVDLPPCDFAIVPPRLDFGLVEVDRKLALTFDIVNLATNPADACLISMLDVGSGSTGFTLIDGPIQSKSIAGGDALPVRVRFAPTAAGAHAGSVEFFISSPTRPTVSVPLSGVAGASCLMIAPRELEFGTLPVNCSSRDHQVTIYNNCGLGSVVVLSIDLQQGGSEFIISQRPSLPAVISSGGQISFSARYHPTAVGENFGTVAIATNGTTNITVIPVAGSGAVGATQTDVFSQGSTPMADVLFVVDDSCSMTPHQDALAANFDSFVQYALNLQVDYRIAITTVSWDLPKYACGRFVPLPTSPNPGNPKVITPTTPNKQLVFSQNVRVGTGGTVPFDESAIWPAYAALSSPLINGWNAGFYRDEATLAVIVVTDTKDHDPLENSVSFYEAFFTNLKGSRRRSDFSYNGILPLSDTVPAGCHYQADWLETRPGRAETLVAATGGFQADICSPDWAATMEQVGKRAFGKRSKFFLSQVPDQTGTYPITVTVDGFAIPQLGPRGDTHWAYDPFSQAIVFEPLAVPDPGSTVEINYTVACL